MLVGGHLTVASGLLSAKFPTWIKPLVTPIFRLNIIKRCSTFGPVATENISGRCSPNVCVPTNSLAHFYTQHNHKHYIIEFYTPGTSLYILGATLSVSSQRHFEYILYLKRITAFSHMVSTKPIARLYGMRGKHTFEGQDLCF